MPDGVHAQHVIAPRGQPAPRGDHGEGGSGDHLVEDPALRLAETLLALVTEDVVLKQSPGKVDDYGDEEETEKEAVIVQRPASARCS